MLSDRWYCNLRPIGSQILRYEIFLGKCHKELALYHQRLAVSEGIILGAYEPYCKDDGDYKAKQCNPSAASCWCVNTLTGEKIPDTEEKTFVKNIDCSEYESK